MDDTTKPSTQRRGALNPPSWLVRIVPGLRWMSAYQVTWLRHDLVAGVTVAAVIVPIALAYGDLAGMPAITGIYASILPLVAYALFGSSRQLIMGPDASSAALVAVAVAPLALGDPVRYAALAAMLAVLVGALCMLGGLVRLGMVADFLSRPILTGYMNGLALIVIAGQLHRLFGIPITSSTFFGQVGEWLSKLGQAHWLTLTLGMGVLALVLLLRRLAPQVPGPLLAVILATLIAGAFHLDATGVAVLGQIPAGLPRLGLPGTTVSDLGALLASAFGIMLLTFSDTILNGRSFAAQTGTDIDANQELIGLGAGQLAAGLSQGFPISASGARTAINISVGGKTQLTGLVAALALIVMLVFFTSPLGWLPQAALGAVLVAAVIGLIDIKSFVTLYRVRKQELVIAVATLVGVLLLGLLNGIIVAVLLSLILLLRRVVRPHDAILGKVKGLDGFHDIGDYPDSETVPGLIVYRFDAPLFFANASYLKSRVELALSEAKGPVKWLLLDAEAITDLDSTASEALRELCAMLVERGITFAIARAKFALRTMLTRTGLTERIGEEHFFPSIRVAVAAYQATQAAEQ